MKVNFKEREGITLVALVITIIILLILAGVAISSLSNSGLINRAIQAREETKISEYTEKIELIKTEVRLSKTNPTETPILNEFKAAFDKEKWVDSTEIIIDKDIEKLKLTTKEGYIFYITANKTEYKGKGIVVDTSALEKDDVLKLEITTTTENGKNVKITDITGVDYYKVQYQIDLEDGEWTEVKSGDEVEVSFGQTIYARLVYGTNYGVNHRMSIAHTKPIVTLSTDNYSNVTRKTDIPLSDIFQVTWGSEGIGQVYYNIKGKLKFNNTTFESLNTDIRNISELELGTYTITLGVATPSQAENNQATWNSNWTVTINLANLSQTTVANASNQQVSAYAIYSEYDLAYFRDLVNDGSTTLNAKQMADIDLTNVCSKSIGSWIPVGACNTNSGISQDIIEAGYNGIFDGNNKKVSGIYIYESSLYRQGLFSLLNENAYLKNITTYGNITALKTSAGIVGYNYGVVENCINNVSVTGMDIQLSGISGINKGTIKKSLNNGDITGIALIAGIAARNEGTIELSCNKATIIATGANSEILDNDEGTAHSFAGGIVGRNLGTITKSINLGTVNSNQNTSGGITGRNLGDVSYCMNCGNINGQANIGGIAGNNRRKIEYVYCIDSEIIGLTSNVGGIIGNQNKESTAYIHNAYNTATIGGQTNVGGIVGAHNIGTISNTYNIGSVSGNSSIGQIYGITYSTSEVTSTGSTTESTMKSWTQSTITSNIGSGFIKETNSLPIFNIKLTIYNNYVF